MERLVGTFTVDLPCRIYVSGPKEKGCIEHSFLTSVDEFDVRILLPPDEALQRETEEMLIWAVSHASVVVDRACGEVVPAYPTSSCEDYEQQAMEYNNFFMLMLQSYSLAGTKGLNRLLRFFRFNLRNHHATMVYTSGFLNVVWSDESGKIYPFKLHYMKPSPDLFYFWCDDKVLTPDCVSDLEDHLTADLYPDLHLELLVEAWAALEQKNERRAVIEGAIACETAVKAAFFGFDTVAAGSFEYLEEQTRSKLPVTQFLHSVSKRVFGRSFKDEKPEEYKRIDALFRVRNKAAHRGLCYFRDDQGRVEPINDQLVGQWLKAVDAVFQWLGDVYDSLEAERRQLQPFLPEVPNQTPTPTDKAARER